MPAAIGGIETPAAGVLGAVVDGGIVRAEEEGVFVVELAGAGGNPDVDTIVELLPVAGVGLEGSAQGIAIQLGEERYGGAEEARYPRIARRKPGR